MPIKINSIEITDTDGIDIKHSFCSVLEERVRVIMNSFNYLLASGIEGDIAEFGVQQATFPPVYAFALNLYESAYTNYLDANSFRGKKIHLFDSFEGYPDITSDVDRTSHVQHMTEAMGKGKMFGGLPPEDVATAVSKKTVDIIGQDRVVNHVGYFEDTLKGEKADLKFAFTHIDCDLYSSAKDCLNYLFGENRMTNGSVILFGGGWNHQQASPDHGYRRAWRETVEAFNVEFSDSGEIAGWGHKFIIHVR